MKLISLLVDVRVVQYVNVADHDDFTHTKLDNLNLFFHFRASYKKFLYV